MDGPEGDGSHLPRRGASEYGKPDRHLGIDARGDRPASTHGPHGSRHDRPHDSKSQHGYNDDNLDYDKRSIGERDTSRRNYSGGSHDRSHDRFHGSPHGGRRHIAREGTIDI